MKTYKIVDYKERFVSFETGTCELCFGNATGTESEFLFEDNKGNQTWVDGYYYTEWDNWLNSVEIDNIVNFSDWLQKQAFLDDHELSTDQLFSMSYDYDDYLEEKASKD